MVVRTLTTQFFFVTSQPIPGASHNPTNLLQVPHIAGASTKPITTQTINSNPNIPNSNSTNSHAPPYIANTTHNMNPTSKASLAAAITHLKYPTSPQKHHAPPPSQNPNSNALKAADLPNSNSPTSFQISHEPPYSTNTTHNMNPTRKASPAADITYLNYSTSTQKHHAPLPNIAGDSISGPMLCQAPPQQTTTPSTSLIYPHNAPSSTSPITDKPYATDTSGDYLENQVQAPATLPTEPYTSLTKNSNDTKSEIPNNAPKLS
ncbi:hypothetical protein LIER_28824 [Lithospermum erythrorhizon]|uniref:Uncharacterized protein n=1 Tax=Lithospermum erythrorhizon TaxID=34254 RepID=A0AAV3RKH6_LITER